MSVLVGCSGVERLRCILREPLREMLECCTLRPPEGSGTPSSRTEQGPHHTQANVKVGYPAVFKDAFHLFFVPPPSGGQGEGPDWHLPLKTESFGEVSVRIWGVISF